MAQNDLDRLQIAWTNLQKAVNKHIPDTTDKLWAIRNKLAPPGGPGPRPS